MIHQFLDLRDFTNIFFDFLDRRVNFLVLDFNSRIFPFSEVGTGEIFNLKKKSLFHKFQDWKIMIKSTIQNFDLNEFFFDFFVSHNCYLDFNFWCRLSPFDLS